jgi:hypothetical protein
MRQMLRLSLASGGWLHYLAPHEFAPTIRFANRLCRFPGQTHGQPSCAAGGRQPHLYHLLALVPLFTIALTVISAFPVFADYSTRFKVMLLSTLVPEFAGKVISVYMRQFADNAEKLTAAGIVMLGVTALMLMSRSSAPSMPSGACAALGPGFNRAWCTGRC